MKYEIDAVMVFNALFCAASGLYFILEKDAMSAFFSGMSCAAFVCIFADRLAVHMKKRMGLKHDA